MTRLVTVSYTGLDAPGGVPQFNRDLHAAFPEMEHRHWCWQDVSARCSPPYSEWEAAWALNRWLVSTGKVTKADVVVADGFWAAGLESLPFAVSTSHGIWSHLTDADVQAGKAPDMPHHHAAQVEFRRRWCSLGKRLTSVSDFIAQQMRIQWGFESRVINNGVDTDRWVRTTKRFPRHRTLVLHGVNDPTNVNKGADHIRRLEHSLDAEVLSLDAAEQRYGGPKEWTLAQADLFVHPSGYEGNSMMVAQALACGLPFVGYRVGALGFVPATLLGEVMLLSQRCPENTLSAVQHVLEEIKAGHGAHWATNARQFAVDNLSMTRFRQQWQDYVGEMLANPVPKPRLTPSF